MFKKLFSAVSACLLLLLGGALHAHSGGFGTFSSTDTLVKRTTPQQVGVGITIDQITFVDQQAENFGIVGTLFLKADYPQFAFDAAAHGSDVKTYSNEAFRQLLNDAGAQPPYFILRNQQGRRFTQQVSILLKDTGEATYAERFTATLQAPHFNFKRYPFDTQ